ncbi:hydrogenase subunit MbhD domain-containing protein [Pseudothermotoga thermarum]|uniref:MrpA C-terminal/MbhD domain-containing protein n=1 Tax=Pseudothermotoga thermarum DSM 5069 TaxID=688269 RepID=F7YTZ8_9THEM|nr:hydrogenase subunit MbhD domain-containing protein [Pseudothermotoga thermarum]AEH51580.1 hypothetical protein Theth_1527 [Pseudothermotoga thermarum DSM 5069]
MLTPKLIFDLTLVSMAFFSLVAVYFCIVEKDLLKALIISALQSLMYTVIFFLLKAPDIALVYIAVSGGIYSAVILFLIYKTKRFED